MNTEHKLTPYYKDVLNYLAEAYGSTGSIEARNVNKESLAMAGIMLDLLEVNTAILEELKAIKADKGTAVKTVTSTKVTK
jgi:hypothetical protein